MKVIINLIILIFGLFDVAYGHVALGVEYDSAKVVSLKFPLKGNGKRILLSEADRASGVNVSVDVDPRFFPRIDKLLDKSNDFDNGLGDSSFQAYAIIFFKGGDVVLTVAPNLLGGDIYASDNDKKYDPRSFSRAQLSEFLNICFQVLSSLQVSKEEE